MKVKNKKALMVYNPFAGKKKSHKTFPAVITKLQEMGYDLTIYQPFDLLNMDNPIKRACQNRWDAIFIAGGDGTVNQTIQFLAAEEF
jgi:diacylglycerol kinase (ATP)